MGSRTARGSVGVMVMATTGQSLPGMPSAGGLGSWPLRSLHVTEIISRGPVEPVRRSSAIAVRAAQARLGPCALLAGW